jgi:hypothetical protein
MTDWIAWHREYDDPTSSLARRLAVVRGRIGHALDLLGTGPLRILSLCAGDGRDVIPVLAAHPRALDVSAVLVERDPLLADAARERVAATGLDRVDVRCGDASTVTNFVDTLPVDLLMLCGIFGNVTEDDIDHTISSSPSLLRPGGYVLWTRGAHGPGDVRGRIRRRFVDCGFDEVSYESEPEGFGVGLDVLRGRPPASPLLPDRLFTFLW